MTKCSSKAFIVLHAYDININMVLYPHYKILGGGIFDRVQTGLFPVYTGFGGRSNHRAPDKVGVSDGFNDSVNKLPIIYFFLANFAFILCRLATAKGLLSSLAFC